MAENNSIGKRIAKLRKDNKWTQSALAAKLNVEDKTVSKWENDGGTPNFDIIPKIAEVFEVPIDYLFTGKGVDGERISELELCVKNDNAKTALLLKKERDEMGKTVVDYAIEYRNKNILCELIKSDLSVLPFDGVQGYTDIVLKLLPCDVELVFAEKVRSVYGGRYSYSSYPRQLKEVDGNKITEFSYPAIVKYLIDNYEDLSDGQKNYYFGKDGWYFAYPYFMVRAFGKNKKLFNEFLQTYVGEMSHYAPQCVITPLLKTIAAAYGKNEKAYSSLLEIFEKKLGKWKIDDEFMEFIKSIYLSGDKKAGDRLNKAVGSPYTSQQTREFLIEGDNSKSEREKLLEKCVYNGYLWIDKAMKEDIRLLEELLKKYPVCIAEKLLDFVSKGDFKAVFEYAVDENIPTLAKAVMSYVNLVAVKEDLKDNDVDEKNFTDMQDRYFAIQFDLNDKIIGIVSEIINCSFKCNSDEILKSLLEDNEKNLCEIAFKNAHSYNVKETSVAVFVNREKIIQSGNLNTIKVEGRVYNIGAGQYFRVGDADKYYEQAADIRDYKSAINNYFTFIKIFKQDVLEHAIGTKLIESDNKKKEYFLEKVDSGDSEFAILMLCAKFENILKSKYSYEGTFYEMLDKYCNDKVGDKKISRLLNKLRMTRNEIAHGAKNAINISDSEIKECVDYICALGEEI